MHKLPNIHYTLIKEELIQQVADFHRELVEFYKEIPDDILDIDPVPDGWSIAKNMKHIASSNKFYALWIGAPRFLIKLRGKPRIKRTKIEAIKVTNRINSDEIGYYPLTAKHNPDPGRKKELMESILASSESLQSAILKRTDEELENLSGPFTGMNIKNFIYFILKHNQYHSNVVRLRLENL